MPTITRPSQIIIDKESSWIVNEEGLSNASLIPLIGTFTKVKQKGQVSSDEAESDATTGTKRRRHLPFVACVLDK